MTVKEQLQAVVDTLSEDDAALLLRALSGDQLAWTLLNAPLDDEPESPEEHAAVEEAYEDVRAGRVVGWDEVKRELGV